MFTTTIFMGKLNLHKVLIIMLNIFRLLFEYPAILSYTYLKKSSNLIEKSVYFCVLAIISQDSANV